MNILTPLIFEGLQSIYKEALVFKQDDEILKIYQTCLKNIPKWSQSIIEKETDRIVNSSQSYGWLNDLIKATIKSNLYVLMYNPSVKTQTKINPDYYKHIRLSDFIHKIYIECAREFWNNPYLFYHEYEPIEIKRNQRDCLVIIKECMKEAIRKLLPVKEILQIYLNEEFEPDDIPDEQNIHNNNEMKTLNYYNKDNVINNNMVIDMSSHSDSSSCNNNLPPQEFLIDNQDDSSSSSSVIPSEHTIKSRILDIIKDNSPQHRDATSNFSLEEKNISNHYSPTSDIVEDKHEIDDKIRQILNNELNSETELNYKTTNNEHKEVYSNSNVLPIEENDNKLFTNYLNI